MIDDTENSYIVNNSDNNDNLFDLANSEYPATTLPLLFSI